MKILSQKEIEQNRVRKDATKILRAEKRLEEIFAERKAHLEAIDTLNREKCQLQAMLTVLQPKEPTFLPIPRLMSSEERAGVLPFMRP